MQNYKCFRCHDPKFATYRHPVEGATYEPIVCNKCGLRKYEWRSYYDMMPRTEKEEFNALLDQAYKELGFPRPEIKDTISAWEIYFDS